MDDGAPRRGRPHRPAAGQRPAAAATTTRPAGRSPGAATRWCRGPAECATASSASTGRATSCRSTCRRTPSTAPASSAGGRCSTPGCDYCDMRHRPAVGVRRPATPAPAARRARPRVHAHRVRQRARRCPRSSAGTRASPSRSQADLEFAQHVRTRRRLHAAARAGRRRRRIRGTTASSSRSARCGCTTRG